MYCKLRISNSIYILIITILISLSMLFLFCSEDTPVSTDPETHKTWDCVITTGTVPDSSREIGCIADFTVLASPLSNENLPADAFSIQTVIDDWKGNSQLFFQNTKKYNTHWNFASAILSGKGKPEVPAITQFNETEYSSKDRRFLLGSITYCESLGVWIYEISPNDNASAEMINLAYQKIVSSCYFGDSLYFHPTSQDVEKVAESLPDSVLIITTDELCSEGNCLPKSWSCLIDTTAVPDSSREIGCITDFEALASQPMDASIPGAISLKTVIDDWKGNSQLYFQNSKKFLIHWEFTSKNLSGKGYPVVPALAQFNETEYSSKNRRFLLGAITYYENPGIWTYEISPYDNASAEMISHAYHKIVSSCYFGDSLYFHPTSQGVEKVAESLPESVKIITTDELYAGIDYQPLNYGTSMGKLVFITAKQLETEYVSFRDIVVLDAVPNDISVTSGIITQMFQTPLSHINVLSQNRGTPNMGLREACTNEKLLALKDKWVKMEVGPFEYKVTEVTKEEADAWWESHRPSKVSIATMNLDIKDLRNVEDILDLEKMSFDEAIDSAIPAFGGKASHFGAFPHMDSSKVPYPKGFAIPVFYYWQFMQQNGFSDYVTEMLENPEFQSDASTRDQQLKLLRDGIENAPVDTAFRKLLMSKLQAEYAGIRMRFRSSTNAEDLDGFTGAGLYTSKSGDPSDPESVMEAIKKVWASVWFFRAFEERNYRNIGHETVGMALLVHQSFPEEEASGVAITANPYDPSGMEPGFYVNVQYGDESVVLPSANTTTDQFIYHFHMAGQPIVFMGHSNLIDSGTTVLTRKQTYQLGVALDEIHKFFQPIYGKDPNTWFAMDTEFKFDQPPGDPNGEPVLSMKQARPYPGMNSQ